VVELTHQHNLEDYGGVIFHKSFNSPKDPFESLPTPPNNHRLPEASIQEME
jgi:hypothetical protein